MPQIIVETDAGIKQVGLQNITDAITLGAKTDTEAHQEILGALTAQAEKLDTAIQKIDEISEAVTNQQEEDLSALQCYAKTNLILSVLILTLLILHHIKTRTTKNVEMVARRVGEGLTLPEKILDEAVQFCVENVNLTDEFSAGPDVAESPTKLGGTGDKSRTRAPKK